MNGLRNRNRLKVLYPGLLTHLNKGYKAIINHGMFLRVLDIFRVYAQNTPMNTPPPRPPQDYSGDVKIKGVVWAVIVSAERKRRKTSSGFFCFVFVFVFEPLEINLMHFTNFGFMA